MNVCKYCQREFVPKVRGRGGREQRFCSKQCSASGVVVYRRIVCSDCGRSFKHKGRGWRLRCSTCQKRNAVERTTRCRVRAGKMECPGVGSGGNQWGSKNHSWKPVHLRKSTKYLGNYRRRCFRVWERKCVICAAKTNVMVHHIDGDVDNYRADNLVPLCAGHHKRVHDRKPRRTANQYAEALFKLWPSGRKQIAERTGIPSSGQPERKDVGNTATTRND